MIGFTRNSQNKIDVGDIIVKEKKMDKKGGIKSMKETERRVTRR